MGVIPTPSQNMQGLWFERETRIDLATFSLATRCSTAELLPLNINKLNYHKYRSKALFDILKKRPSRWFSRKNREESTAELLRFSSRPKYKAIVLYFSTKKQEFIKQWSRFFWGLWRGLLNLLQGILQYSSETAGLHRADQLYRYSYRATAAIRPLFYTAVESY